MTRPPAAAPIRDERRRALFWKQIERAAADVAAWPDYVKRAFGVTVLPRNLTHCATCDRPFPEPMTHWDDYFVDIEDAAFVCEACPEVFDD